MRRLLGLILVIVSANVFADVLMVDAKTGKSYQVLKVIEEDKYVLRACGNYARVKTGRPCEDFTEEKIFLTRDEMIAAMGAGLSNSKNIDGIFEYGTKAEAKKALEAIKIKEATIRAQMEQFSISDNSKPISYVKSKLAELRESNKDLAFKIEMTELDVINRFTFHFSENLQNKRKLKQLKKQQETFKKEEALLVGQLNRVSNKHSEDLLIVCDKKSSLESDFKAVKEISVPVQKLMSFIDDYETHELNSEKDSAQFTAIALAVENKRDYQRQLSNRKIDDTFHLSYDEFFDLTRELRLKKYVNCKFKKNVGVTTAGTISIDGKEVVIAENATDGYEVYTDFEGAIPQSTAELEKMISDRCFVDMPLKKYDPEFFK